MKKLVLIAVVLFVLGSIAAMAQPTIGTTGYTKGQGIINMDKLGAHQNGGRGCTGCHAPHSGARGNGGSLTVNSQLTGNTIIPASTGVSYGGQWSNQTAISGGSGDEELWGQDIGPVLGLGSINTGGTEANPSGFKVDFTLIGGGNYGRMTTGIVFCLSCHDGNVAKGAMMTNASYEQAAGLLPSTYGSQTIPTLLGADGGPTGNYLNDHPLGPLANVAALGATNIKGYLVINGTATALAASGTFAGSGYQQFQANYGLPVVLGARAGAGFATDFPGVVAGGPADNAYVVCTTCHTPHTMFRATASSTNPIASLTSGAFPSFFFLAAPYNPAAQVQNGALASSATQFCRQCHYSGAGGANESVGIYNIYTAF
jgi:hypothetical protein